MRVRVLRAKLYSYALPGYPGSTARESRLRRVDDSYSTPQQLDIARQLDSSTELDRPRQTSTDLDAQAHAVRLDGLDSYSTATVTALYPSTEARPGK